MKFTALLFAGAAVGRVAADFVAYPNDPLPPVDVVGDDTTTTPMLIIDPIPDDLHPYDPLPDEPRPVRTTAGQAVQMSCSDCVALQTQGMNIACGQFCDRPVDNGDRTTAAPLARQDDICYQFCEDGSAPNIKRECANGLECKSPLGPLEASFDQCGGLAYTCVRADKPAMRTTVLPSKPKFTKGQGGGKPNAATKPPAMSNREMCEASCADPGECSCSFWNCECMMPIVDPMYYRCLLYTSPSPRDRG